MRLEDHVLVMARNLVDLQAAADEWPPAEERISQALTSVLGCLEERQASSIRVGDVLSEGAPVDLGQILENAWQPSA